MREMASGGKLEKKANQDGVGRLPQAMMRVKWHRARKLRRALYTQSKMTSQSNSKY